MAYILITDGGPTYPYSVDQLRADNPDTSFSAVIPDERLSDWGVFPVATASPPEAAADEQAVEVVPALIEGVWTQQWELVARNEADLALLKQEKQAAVRARRDIEIDGGCPVEGIGVFDSDLPSRQNINGAVTGAMIAQGAGAPFTISWKLADNSLVALDAAQMIAAGLAVLGRVAACHANAQAIGVAIDAAEDFATLNAIDLEAGWP